jgi:hypothetical protein
MLRANGDTLILLNFSVHADSSTGSELKAVEEACREASRTVEAFRIVFQQPASTTVSINS